MDQEALEALADGMHLNLDTLETATASAAALGATLSEAKRRGGHRPPHEKPFIRISRQHHGKRTRQRHHARLCSRRGLCAIG